MTHIRKIHVPVDHGIFNADGSLTNAFKAKVPAVFESSYTPDGPVYKIRMDIVREALKELIENGERRRNEAKTRLVNGPSQC